LVTDRGEEEPAQRQAPAAGAPRPARASPLRRASITATASGAPRKAVVAHIVFVDHVGEESPSLTFVARTQARRPLYTSAAGKTLLANVPDDEMNRLLDLAAPEQAAEVRQFLAELPEIRSRRLTNGLLARGYLVEDQRRFHRGPSRRRRRPGDRATLPPACLRARRA
jgi:hypothetical protein